MPEVRVLSNGIPKEGATVFWEVNSGTITSSSVTDANGYAHAQWTPAGGLGEHDVFAYLALPNGNKAAWIFLDATVITGPQRIIEPKFGDGGSLPINRCNHSLMFGTAVYDRFRNPVSAPVIVWQVIDGPAMAQLPGPNAPLIRSFIGTGVGVVKVRAQLPGVGAGADFNATFTNAVYEIIVTDDYGDPYMVSSQNCRGSEMDAPTDTIPAGETARWIGKTYWDFRIISVGEPSLPPGTITKGNETYSYQFKTPGTYHYVMEAFPTLVGTMVVR